VATSLSRRGRKRPDPPAGFARRGASAASIHARVRAAWLFSRRVDLALLVVPGLVTLAGVAFSAAAGDASGGSERAYANWIAQFILGNSTHVILTFLLLGARRDVLHAAPGQARVVIAGSIAAFFAAFALFSVTIKAYPVWSDFGVAIGVVFATHHGLSQAKGFWSLHHLRGKEHGLAPPGDAERRVHGLFVPIGLSLVLVRWLFVPASAASMFPFVQAVPAEAAILPFEITYALLGVWCVFALAVAHAVTRPEVVSGPKLLYLSGHVAGVALLLASPGWGGTFLAAVHGLEYAFLCARMLRPTSPGESARLDGPRVVPALALAMLPLFVIGVVNAPFTPLFGLAAYASLFAWGRITLNAVVMAHYFADAFIYRFRIPEVRRVALARLGFTA
jgi:hypothetical protein